MPAAEDRTRFNELKHRHPGLSNREPHEARFQGESCEGPFFAYLRLLVKPFEHAFRGVEAPFGMSGKARFQEQKGEGQNFFTKELDFG